MTNVADEAIEVLSDRVRHDMLVIMGYALLELAPHTTPEGLIENCARSTHIDPAFIREYVNECRKEYFNRLLKKD